MPHPKLSNRAWENHLKAKGFIPFIYDRLSSYAMSMPRQGNPFEFIPRDDDDNPLASYFFRFSEVFPYIVYIELTNRCNLDCVFCARRVMKREQGFMSMGLYKRLIDEIAEKLPFCQVHLYGIGESTLHPNLLGCIEYAVSRGLTNLVLFTNGKKLPENDLYRKIVNTGIGTIGVDLDGFTKASYEQVRRGAVFEDVKKVILDMKRYILKKGSNQRIELAYQIYKGLNEDDVEAFTEWCNEVGLEYKIVPMHQWAGLRADVPIDKTLDDSRVKKRNSPCCALWQGLMIYWDGRVGVCFQDADCSEIMGDLKKESIKLIWQTSMREKRIEHISGKFRGLCSTCKEYLYNNLPPCMSPVYPRELFGRCPPS